MLNNFQYWYICIAFYTVIIATTGANKLIITPKNDSTNIVVPMLRNYNAEYSLCSSNPPGNYPNPLDCNKFITCISGGAYWYTGSCPAPSLYYLPFRDICAYSSDNLDCPKWTQFWNGGPITCDRLGQRQWWSGSPLLLPAEPETLCGPKTIQCFQYTEIRRCDCPHGTGYSKLYMGCISLSICHTMDRYIFGS